MKSQKDNRSCMPSAYDLLTGAESLPEPTIQKDVLRPHRQKALDAIKSGKLKNMGRVDLSEGSPVAKATEKLHEGDKS